MEGFHLVAFLGVLTLLRSSLVTSIDTIDHDIEPPKEGDLSSRINQNSPTILLSANSTSSESSGFVVLLPDSVEVELPLNDSGTDINEVDGNFVGMGSVLVVSVNDTVANDTNLSFSKIPKIDEDFIRKKRSSEGEEIREKRSPHHKKHWMMMMMPQGCGGGCSRPQAPPPPCGQSPCGQQQPQYVYVQPQPQHPPPRPQPRPQPQYHPQPQPQPHPQQPQCCPCGQPQGASGSYSMASSMSASSSGGWGKRKR